MLTLFSAITLLEHYGLVSYDFGTAAGLVIGVPFLVLAVAEIWLAIAAVRKYWRTRAGGGV
jgi:hypothetical protein